MIQSTVIGQQTVRCWSKVLSDELQDGEGGKEKPHSRRAQILILIPCDTASSKVLILVTSSCPTRALTEAHDQNIDSMSRFRCARAAARHLS